jgi:hypothetical protein
MIDRVTGNKALPESIRQDIIERTDGVPLFVEEMTKATPHFMSISGIIGNPTVGPTARKTGKRAYAPFLRRCGASPLADGGRGC